MQWLARNGIWILLAFGMCWVMRRGGMGCCGMGGHRHERRDEPDGTLHDPVTGHPVDKAVALTSVYQNQTYWFESSRNRETFENNPQPFIRSRTDHR